MGTKSWVLKRTAKRGSQNWVDFFKKKNAFRTTFSHVSCKWGQNLGFFLSTRQHIYIYTGCCAGIGPVEISKKKIRLRWNRNRQNCCIGIGTTPICYYTSAKCLFLSFFNLFVFLFSPNFEK